MNDGSTVVTSGTENYIFVLKKNSTEGLEFVKYTGSAPLPTNKAYLSVSASNFNGGARLSVLFDDEASAIEGIQTVRTNGDIIYNLQGQKVENVKKGGLYIINVKKQVVK